MGIGNSTNSEFRIPNPEVLIQQIPDYRENEIRFFLEQAFSLIPAENKIKSSDKVLVKPNFLSPKPVESCVATHPAVILETCKILLDLGAKVSIGDSPARGSAQMVARKLGIDEPAKKMGIDILNFATQVSVEINNPIRFRRLDLAKESLGFDRVINLAKFKTHDLFNLTLALKNLFGCVVGKRKPMYHLEAEHNFNAFCELLLEIFRYYSPALSLIDGIIAMEGNGPNNGDPRRLGVLMASVDAVALDRVAGELTGVPLEYDPLCQLGAKHNLGNANLDQVRIIGPKLEELKVADFKFRHLGPPDTGRITPVVRWFIGDWATRRPYFDHKKCTRCSACIDICPAKALSFVPQKNKSTGYKQRVKINRDKCIHCFCCQEVCPEGAIRSEKSWLARKLLD